MKAGTETQGRRGRYGMIAILIAAGIGVFIWGGYEPLYPDVGPYVGGKPLEPVNWDKLKAGVIMKMAYESNQSTQGKPLYYYLGFVVILIGLAGFYCPEAAFYLGYPIWVENPKPSDDYIIAAKAGAVLAVLFGFFLILRALGISS
ncbi:hypothetical protein ACE3MS_00675 [Paenibacillus dendritiformis]|uniref:hypothetical protein n=1 Tax=Paenibacillus dendritiformis TaxID=130049 RepID=UPI0036599F12